MSRKEGDKIYLRGLLWILNEVKYVENLQSNNAIIIYRCRPAMSDYRLHTA